MKTTFKAKLAKLSVMALAVGGLTAGGVALDATVGTEKAHAGAGFYNCRVIDAGYGYTIGWTGYRYGTYCYVDYGWEEEWFAGQRDGWKFVWFHSQPCSAMYNVCASSW